jgi:hypothetical protein
MTVQEMIQKIRELPRINWYQGGMMQERDNYPKGKFRACDVEAILSEYETEYEESSQE